MFSALVPTSDTQRFVMWIAITQLVCAVGACALLGKRSTRTGWAQDLGLVSAAICAADPLVNAAFIYARIRPMSVRVVSCLFITLSYAGIVSLVSNTEDDQHPGIIDNIEVSVCLFVLAMAAQCSRLAVVFMEGVILDDKAYKRALIIDNELNSI